MPVPTGATKAKDGAAPAPATDTDDLEAVTASGTVAEMSKMANLLGAKEDMTEAFQEEVMPDDQRASVVASSLSENERAKTFAFKDPKVSISGATPEELLAAFSRQDSCSKATLEKMIEKVSTMHKSEQKSKARAKFFFSLVVLLFMVVGGLVAAMWLIVDGSKESHVNSATLVNLEGESVATRSVTSYADLFDLVQFDLKTLLNVKVVNVVLEDNQEVALSISSVSRKRFENTQNTTTTETLTLFSSGENKVVIYPTYETASVRFDGSSYVVRQDKESRRLREGGPHKARLYSASEWFTEENGFASDGRRLQYYYASYSSYTAYSTLSTDMSSLDSSYDGSFVSGVVSKLGSTGTSWSKSSSDVTDDERVAVKAFVDDAKGWNRRREAAQVGRCDYWWKQVEGPARRRVLTATEYAAGLACYDAKYKEVAPPATCSASPRRRYSFSSATVRTNTFGGRLLGAMTKAEAKADKGAGTPQDGSEQSPQQMVQALKDRSLRNSGRFEEPVVSEGFERSLSDKACDGR